MTETTTVDQLSKRGAIAYGDGYRTKRAEHGQSGYRILRVADVLDNQVLLNGSDFVREEFVGAIGSKTSQPGDVLLTTKGTVGRVAIFPRGVEQVVYSPQLCYFRVIDPEVIHPRFLAFWFKSDSFVRQAGDRANNTDMAAYINLRDIGSLELNLPAIAEQRNIAEALGALDDKISANDKILRTTRSLLAASFSGLKVDQEPNGEESIDLSSLIELNPRYALPARTETTYLEMKNLPDRAMTVSNWSSRKPLGGARFRNGDTLLARITPCLENGKVGFVDFLESGETGVGSTEFIVLRSMPGLPAILPYLLATSDRFREFAIRHMAGTTGRQRLAASDLATYTLTRPSESKLVRFGRLADALMPRVKAAVSESRLLASTRDELLPLLMSGRIRVRDAERQVEDVL